MIEIYCKLIINKRRSFDKVPDEFKEAVKDRLIDLGYDVDGNPIDNSIRGLFLWTMIILPYNFTTNMLSV